MGELLPAERVWIKLSHDDVGQQGLVNRRREEPDYDDVTVDGRVLRRNRNHLRRLRPEAPDNRGDGEGHEGPETDERWGIECDSESEGENEARRSGRMTSRRHLMDDHVYY